MNKYKYLSYKTILLVLSSVTTLPLYNGYQKSVALSKYETAAVKLGFSGYSKINLIVNAADQQEALLKQLQILGFLKPQEIWQGITHLKFPNPEKIFHQIYAAIKESNADKNSIGKFNAKILRKNFAKDTELDEQDVIDLILYLAQRGYNRQPGQERNELPVVHLTENEQQEYLSSAKILRLIDAERPQEKEYDEAWIAGASRVGLLSRIIDYNNTLFLHPDITINGKTRILAGARELWANIDGIIPEVLAKLIDAHQKRIDVDKLDVSVPTGDDKERNEEGLDYMLNLAARYKIALDPDLSFIEYKTKEECPPGRFPGRLYANYAKNESVRLTETLMSKDMLATYKLDISGAIIVIDTPAKHNQRPTTSSTAYDAAEEFITRIKDAKDQELNKKAFKILLETNNPYIERQTLAVQREVDKLLKSYRLDKEGYTVKIEGIGFGCKEDISTVSSEFAALMAEKWKTQTEAKQQEGYVSKRPIEYILSHAHSDLSPNISLPELQETSIIGNVFDYLSNGSKSFFDMILP